MSSPLSFMEQLAEGIQAKTARIGVIGLGYVGLPVACMLARSGFNCIGVDVHTTRIEVIRHGRSPIGGDEPGLVDLIADVISSQQLRVTSSYAALKSAQIIIVCVDTPIEPETHQPAYRALRSVLVALGPVLTAGTLVIIESTLAPGTMHDVVLPELEQSSGKRAGIDFFLGHCPERVTPGLLLHNLIHVSRTVGGQTPEIAQVMIALYRNYVQADLDPADLLTAEIVKTAENAYRDVQIAFANELALACEALGANVYTVRELINKSPGRAVLLPGAGVGGHCIPKDPWLLIANLDQAYRAQLIPAARAINDQMPGHMLTLITRALSDHQLVLAGARIAILGYAFREETDDDRDSPSQHLVHALEGQSAIVTIHDPYVAVYKRPLQEVIQDAQAVVIMVAHRAYLNLDLNSLRDSLACPILIDGRHVVDPQTAQTHGFTYYGIGIAH